MVLVEKPERDNLENPGVDGRIILRWIFRELDVGTWTGSSWLRIGTGSRQSVYAITNLRVSQNAGNSLIT